MPRRKYGLITKEKILETAAKLFAMQGYRATTIALIAKTCNINGALVNYYFGDKNELYKNAWEYAHAQAMQAYPLYGRLDEKAPAVKRLKEIIWSDISRRSMVNSCENDILLNELSSPTGLLDDLYEQSFSGLCAALRSAVSEILGDNFPIEVQRLAVLSIFAMCVIPVKQIQKMEGQPDYTFDSEIRSTHVYNFAMAGLLDILNHKN